MTDSQAVWTWGNCMTHVGKPSRPRHIYFIYRRLENGDTEYLNDKRGRLRTWRSREAVIAALRKLVKS